MRYKDLYIRQSLEIWGKVMIRKGLAVVVILLFIGMSVVPSTGVVLKESYQPVSSGATLYVGGSGPGNYTRIQDAIDDSNIGDTVFVYDDSSPYIGNLLMDKSINLIGENKETTVIDGGYDIQVIWVEARGITISGFTLQNADTGLFGNMKNCIVSDNIFSCPQAGIALLKSSNNQIFNNEVVSGHVAGIAFLYASYRNQVFDNTIRNTYAGIYLTDSCIFNKIFSNTIKQCSEYGIWIYESFLNSVNKNNFIDNECSAYFENSSFNLWLGNYWDDWSFSRPRPINGTRYGPLLKTTDPWTTYDWHPAQEPYDI